MGNVSVVTCVIYLRRSDSTLDGLDAVERDVRATIRALFQRIRQGSQATIAAERRAKKIAKAAKRVSDAHTEFNCALDDLMKVVKEVDK
jgi:hypothetical protein